MHGLRILRKETTYKTESGQCVDLEVSPDYDIVPIPKTDIMNRGGVFYAVWDQDAGKWSTNEFDFVRMADAELHKVVNSESSTGKYGRVSARYLSRWGTKSLYEFRKFLKNAPDNYIELDPELTFANTPLGIKDEYRSKVLPYALEEGDYSAWDTLVGKLYSVDERRKLEWAIGSVVAGESWNIQKFVVLYGKGGTGKSTVINIICDLFEGYTAIVDAKGLTSASNQFSTSFLKKHPLVLVQHDSDLSKIEDNTKLNTIVAHEETIVNTKYEKEYPTIPKCMVFIGSNSPVKITDAKSGLIRRLIDVTPTGEKFAAKEYNELIDRIKFEHGAIAFHCLEVFKFLGKHYYDKYKPLNMMYKTDPFFNFVESCYSELSKEEGVSLKQAFAMYKDYCEESGLNPLVMYKFREALKDYYTDFKDTYRIGGKQYRSYFLGFNHKMFQDDIPTQEEIQDDTPSWLSFDQSESLFDKVIADCPAQYAPDDGGHFKFWADVKTKLSDLDTHKLHHVNIPESMGIITFDFDLTDENGNKSLEKNIKAASKMIPTYAELSKSGQAIHLEYYYEGNQKDVATLYMPGVEIKTCVGDSSLRRMVTRCNNLPIAKLTSGVPLKEKKMIDFTMIEDEKHLVNLIEKNLRKEIAQSTAQSIDFIYNDLEAYYKSGRHYDVRPYANLVYTFAAKSTHQAPKCLKTFTKMKFCSADLEAEATGKLAEVKDAPEVFFDIEVFPNLVLICWKYAGEGKPVEVMYNPTPKDVEMLMGMRLIGYNCRRYDNHILYAIWLGKSTLEIYQLSGRIIRGDRDAFYGDAYDISETDVYDYCSKKQGLKKWEIELDIPHQECPYRWDEPVPEEKWPEIADYCKNDVLATEAVHVYNALDFEARKFLSALTGLSLNATTNMHTAKFIFEDNGAPQSQFNYRFLGDCSDAHGEGYTLFDSENRPVFKGYTFEGGKSIYRDEEVGEGGYVYAEPGMYWNVALLDIASMHPSSIIAENLFGDAFTSRFKALRDIRVMIKHKDWGNARTALNGVLRPILEGIESKTDEEQDRIAETLSHALKIVINSVYGLTSASFPNRFKDPRNKDNIVAKRGALFMVNLKHEVQERGFTVAHIKTDSIKIPNATPEIIEFVKEYGQKYGYTFEHESTYKCMCLVNNAVYVAYGDSGKHAGEWITTGAQFAEPFVKKTLFTKEPIEFKDMCQTKSVSTSMYLDMNEGLPEDEHHYVFVGRVGSFVPMLPGAGGGLLKRISSDGTKYDAVTGTKGTRWLESAMVKGTSRESLVNTDYLMTNVDQAVIDISKYGDFEMFRAHENVM